MYRLFILLTLSFSGTSIFSQNRDFDSIYRITATEIIYKDTQKALEKTEYLFSIASEKKAQVKSLLLKSEIFRMSGLNQDAIRTILQADSLVDAQNHTQQLLINGLLATNYREINQLYFSRQYLQKSIEIVANLENSNEKHRLLGNIFQEKAYTEMEGHNYAKAIENVRKSNRNLAKVDTSKVNPTFSIALNNQIIGQGYLKLRMPDSAKFYFKKALDYLDKSPAQGSTLRGFIFDGMANASMLSGPIEDVETYLEMALEIARTGNNFNLQKNIYASKIEFYKDQGEHKKYIDANEEFLTLIKNEESRQATTRASIYEFLEKKYTSTPAIHSNSGRLPVLWGALLLIPLIGIFLWIKFKKPLPKPETKHESIAVKESSGSKFLEKEKQDKINKDYLSEDIMESIWRKLQELELKEYYLDSNLSLASVAAEVGVNHRYLSHTIKQKYGKDFTSYINDLRIAFIIEFLKENPQHLNYKISYLAEKAGFSSHNRFSITFKKSTGISPSELISDLQARCKNEKPEKTGNKIE